VHPKLATTKLFRPQVATRAATSLAITLAFKKQGFSPVKAGIALVATGIEPLRPVVRNCQLAHAPSLQLTLPLGTIAS
jgi:hypothetical protein